MPPDLPGRAGGLWERGCGAQLEDKLISPRLSLSLPIHKMGVLGGIPSGVLSGSDLLLGSFPAGGRQPLVKLITAVGEMEGYHANPSGSGSWRPFLAWEGSRPQETQAPILAGHVSFRVPQSSLLYNGSSTVSGYILGLSSQKVLVRTGCVALCQSIKPSGPKGHICKQGPTKGSPPWGRF